MSIRKVTVLGPRDDGATGPRHGRKGLHLPKLD